MDHLCPRCLTMGAFTEVTTPDGEKYWKCPTPDCGMENIPYRYTERYDAFPPVPFSLIGATAHGKTRFLVGLFKQLTRAADHWPGFYADPLDIAQHDRLEEKLRRYEAGMEEDFTQVVDIPEPLVIRYRGIPRVGGCQVIYFDNAGEAFDESAAKLRHTSAFMKHAPAIVWIVSLREKGQFADDPDRIGDVPPRSLERILGIYQQALSTLGGSPQTQTIVLTLTKGERLLDLPGFPDSARRLLQDDLLDTTTDPWAKLDQVSTDLFAWLRTTRYKELVNRLAETFKAVRVCVVSAQGRELQPGEVAVEFDPKAVLAPLFWLWRTDRPAVTVERNGTTAVYLSVAEAFAAGIPPGSTLRLGPGVHRVEVPLRLQGPVAIVGDGPEHTFLIGTGSRPKEEFVLGVGGSGEVRVSQLTIERQGDLSGDVVRVMNGRFFANRVRFRGGREQDEKSPLGCGLVIGRGASAVLRTCTFQDNARTGVWVFTAGTDTVEMSDCAGRNNRTGVYVSGAGKVTADACRWDGNRYGVRVTDQGQFSATGGGVANNRKDGIEVAGDGRVSLTDFAATGNARNGVEFRDAAGGAIRGGQYTTNTTGVQVGGECRVELTGADVSDNRGDGLVFEDRSGGAVTGGTVAGNDGYGFQLLGGVTVDCKDVRAVGNRSGAYKVAKTVPRLTRVSQCGPGRDDRPKGLFG